MECCKDYSQKIIYDNKEYICSLAFTLNLIGDKYKSLILYHLKDGKLRSGELQNRIQGISNRMFTHSIRKLEKDNLVKRIVHPVVPPCVEYELTDIAHSIIPILHKLNEWGKNFATERDLYVDVK
jgi:DNA-binding HxlR family transcriptional regulator